eukprot:g223.t1
MSYKGSLRHGSIRHGQGSYKYRAGGSFQYDGPWKNGKPHGSSGKLSWPKFDNEEEMNTYEGEFVDGEIMGKGLRTWPDGSSYNGEFVSGEMHGQGSYSSAKEEYVGNWANNRRDGQGRLVQKKQIYEGNFKNHKFHGHGILQERKENGSDGIVIYDGMWENGIRQGQGRSEFFVAIGENEEAKFLHEYQGNWDNDQKQGEGVLVFSNGLTYAGPFLDGLPKFNSASMTAKPFFAPKEDGGETTEAEEVSQNEETGQWSFTVRQGGILPSIQVRILSSDDSVENDMNENKEENPATATTIEGKGDGDEATEVPKKNLPMNRFESKRTLELKIVQNVEGEQEEQDEGKIVESSPLTLIEQREETKDGDLLFAINEIIPEDTPLGLYTVSIEDLTMGEIFPSLQNLGAIQMTMIVDDEDGSFTKSLGSKKKKK